MNNKRFWGATAAAAALLMSVAGTALAQSPVTVATPVTRADGTISLEGTLEFSDLEGGFYTVGGWGLIGNEQVYSAMQGQKVIVTGKEFTGISTRMVKQIEVEVVATELTAARTTPPSALTVQGKMFKLDQGPVVENGVLMLPLRAIVEAAGGSVEWVAETQTINVTLPDRKASFVIGEGKAELNENGHFYFVRNMLPMAQAPLIRNGRTLISADAATSILGFIEVVDQDDRLDLVR